MAVVVVVLLGLVAPAWAQQIPALTVLSATVVASNPGLVSRRAALVQERATLHGNINSLNAQCGAVEEGSAAEASCRKDQAALVSALNSHIQQSNDFNAAAQAAIQNPIMPNLAYDPDAARLSAEQLRLVDARIAGVQKALAVLGDSNPEWARERDRLIEDTHEDVKGISFEVVNLMSLGFAKGFEYITAAHVDAAKAEALSLALKEPMASLPAEEARVSRMLGETQDPQLKGAIQNYLDALHRYRETVDVHEVAEMAGHVRDSLDALKAEFEVMETHPPATATFADGLYVSSATLGSIAIVFAEGTAGTAAAAGSALSSIAVGGREAVNLWQERGQLAALDQNASDRNRMKIELNGRLNDLQQEHDRLAWAVQHAGTAAAPQ